MAIQGNFEMGGRSFAAKQASSGGSKKKKKTFNPRSRDAMYATSDDILQNLIDRKDQLKTQPGGKGDDRNLYQVMMNQFKNKNPQNQEAYASRFPIQNFFTSGLPNIASKIMPGAGVLSLLASIGDKIKGGVSRATDIFSPSSDPVQLSAGVRQGPPAYDASGLAGYQDAIMRNLPPVRSMNPDDMGIMAAQPDFRFDGPFVQNPDDMNIAKAAAPDVFDRLPENMFPETVTAPRRLTATDPSAAALMQQIMNKPINMVDGRDTVGDLQPMYGINAVAMNPEQYILDNPPEIKTGLFNEGGLASINNPQYNMLMNASNFDV